MIKKLKKHEIENDDFRRCQQTQCEFFIKGGCQPCADCKSKPFEIKKSCKRCFECENVPGSIRWGDKKYKSTDKIKRDDLLTKMIEKTIEYQEKTANPVLVIGELHD